MAHRLAEFEKNILVRTSRAASGSHSIWYLRASVALMRPMVVPPVARYRTPHAINRRQYLIWSRRWQIDAC